MSFMVDVKTAVSKLNNKVPFLQPLFEAVTNSLEANAGKIDVAISIDDSAPQIRLDNKKQIYKINGFTITDDGVGFTPENIDSFKKLWTSTKKNLGCKGVGRLTWLKVFKNIKIKSRLDTNEVLINFHEDFSDDEDIIINSSLSHTHERCTSVTFSNVTESFFHVNTEGNLVDNRENGDIDEIYTQIKKHLLVKLALLKQQSKEFSISIHLGSECLCLTTADIPELSKKPFSIKDYNKQPQNFDLYYNISNDGLDQKESYYCADQRIVSKFPDIISLNGIKAKDSIIMLLASKYLDDRVNDERNDFKIDKLQNNETLTDPLSFPRINDVLKNEVEQILLEHYPNIKKHNEDEIEKAINEQPFLANYIREDKTIIKTKNQLIANAKKLFEKQKQSTTTTFSRMLKTRNVDPQIFNSTLEKVKQVAFEELGEYILYRKQIIDALGRALEDETKKEDYIHNLIMPMKSSSDDNIPSIERGYLTNLWLLDDKYMTYSFSASDKTMKQITEAVMKNYAKYKTKDRPDITIFFNREANQKDAIVCELKGAKASADEKDKSLTELPNNISAIRKNIPECNRIWGYIITEIDDEFKDSLKNQDYKPLFTSDKNSGLYFKYFSNTDAFITVLDLRTLIADANARNKLFLEILSQ